MAGPLEARSALQERYARDFVSIGYNLCRDGTDSVAWHGDRIARTVKDPPASAGPRISVTVHDSH